MAKKESESESESKVLDKNALKNESELEGEVEKMKVEGEAIVEKGDSEEKNSDSTSQEIVKTASQEVEKEVENTADRDLSDTLSRISAATVALELNVNCFIDGFNCDEDPIVAEKVRNILIIFLLLNFIFLYE